MVKRGFSLAEALIVMAILSIFFAFGAKVVTRPQKPRSEGANHGYFECVQTGAASFTERYVLNGAVASTRENIDFCEFEARPGSAVFLVRGKCGDTFYNTFEPNINNRLNIVFSNGAMRINGREVAVDATYTAADLEAQLGRDYEDSLFYNDGDMRNDGVIIFW